MAKNYAGLQLERIIHGEPFEKGGIGYGGTILVMRFPKTEHQPRVRFETRQRAWDRAYLKYRHSPSSERAMQWVIVSVKEAG